MNTKKTRQLILIALIPAMMAATTGIYIPMIGANITLQTLFVLLSGFVLGSKAAMLSMFLYLILGSFGLPVFSGFQSGLGVLFGPSGGFILAFPIAAAITGRSDKKGSSRLLYGFLATLTIYAIGIPWLMIQLSLPFLTVLGLMVVFFPGDALKLLAAVRLAQVLDKQL
jgi:biotin transport system substrate-specific component